VTVTSQVTVTCFYTQVNVFQLTVTSQVTVN